MTFNVKAKSSSKEVAAAAADMHVVVEDLWVNDDDDGVKADAVVAALKARQAIPNFIVLLLLFVGVYEYRIDISRSRGWHKGTRKSVTGSAGLKKHKDLSCQGTQRWVTLVDQLPSSFKNKLKLPRESISWWISTRT